MVLPWDIQRQVFSHRQIFFEDLLLLDTCSLERAAFTDILQEIIDCGGKVACVDTYKGWLEIDTFEDYRRAWAKVK